MLATIIGSIALFIGLWANRRGKYLYRKILVGLLSITAILVAYTFGSTYDQYFKMIKEACGDPNLNIECNSHAVGIEVVLFGIALSLLFLGIIFWAIAAAFFTRKEDLYEEEEPFNFRDILRKNRASMTPGTVKSPALLEKQQPCNDNSQQQDELAAWRDVTMFDGGAGEDTCLEKEQRYYKQNSSYDRLEYHDDFNNPKSNQQQGGDRGHKQGQRGNSYLPTKHNDKMALTPPPPVANQSPRVYNKSRVTSGHQTHTTKQRKSLTHDNPGKSQKYRQSNIRQESSDSAAYGDVNGHHGKNKYRKSNSRPLSGLESSYQQQKHHPKSASNKTPTSISPHPFQYPEDSVTRNSFCMTPHQNDDSYDESSGSNSSGRGNSGTHYFQPYGNRAPANHHVPILNSPPTTIEHPLNKKVVRDKRIQSYLQQNNSSSSSQGTIKKYNVS